MELQGGQKTKAGGRRSNGLRSVWGCRSVSSGKPCQKVLGGKLEPAAGSHVGTYSPSFLTITAFSFCGLCFASGFSAALCWMFCHLSCWVRCQLSARSEFWVTVIQIHEQMSIAKPTSQRRSAHSAGSSFSLDIQLGMVGI